MRKFLLFIFIIFLSQKLFAQQFTSLWSDKIKYGINSDCGLLGHDSSGFYVLKNKGRRSFVQKFDNGLKRKDEYLLFKYSKSNGWCRTIKFIDGHILLLIKKYIGNKEHFIIKLVEAKNGSVIKNNINIFDLNGARDSSMDYYIIINKKKQICFCYWGIDHTKEEMRFGNHVFDKNLNEIYRIDRAVSINETHYFPVYNIQYQPTGLLMDDHDNIYLMAQYEETDFGPLGDSIIIHSTIFKTNAYEPNVNHVDLDVSFRSPQKMIFKMSDNGKLFGFSLIKSLDSKYRVGIEHYEFNTSTGQSLSKKSNRFTTDSHSDSVTNIVLDNYHIKNIVLNGNGMFVYLENAVVNYVVRNNIKHLDKASYNDMMVIYINQSNKVEWAQWVSMNQLFNTNFKAASSYTTAFSNTAIILFNDNPVNRNIKEGDEPGLFNGNDESFISLLSIDEKRMSRQCIIPDKRNPFLYMLPDCTYDIGDNQKIFITTRMGPIFKFGLLTFH